MTSTPAPSTSTSTLTARHRSSSNSGYNGATNPTSATTSESPNTLKRKATATAMKRSASVSRSLGAPDTARHVALLSRLSDGFDPYSIFLTPHYTDEQLRRHRGWMRLLPENWKVPFYVLVWYWPPLLLELAVSGSLAMCGFFFFFFTPTKLFFFCSAFFFQPQNTFTPQLRDLWPSGARRLEVAGEERAGRAVPADVVLPVDPAGLQDDCEFREVS